MEAIRKLKSRGSTRAPNLSPNRPWGPVEREQGQTVGRLLLLPHFSVSHHLFPLDVHLSPVGCFECTLPGGSCGVLPLSSEERSFVGPRAGPSLGWGGAWGPGVQEMLLSLPLPWQNALASFYVGIYYKWPCGRHSVTHTCTLGSPPGHSLMAFQCGGRKLVSLGVKFALTGLGVW